jgi:metal-responsive CopG/Arc/MetJ family transcriptional regulator
MAKVLSLKLRDDIFQEIEDIIHKIKKSRNAYINEALAFYNQENRKKLLKKALELESQLVRKNSLEVLEEFEKLEDRILE